jgi:CheY-like chemotaxis protein
MNNYKPILHIEDDEIDAMVIKRAVKILGVPNKLIRKENGEEALNYLTGENNEKPGVILLDLFMPRMNGREFLRIVRNDPNLNRIPVIVLATSDRDRDLTGQNVVGYIFKSLCFDEFVISIKSEFEKLNSYYPIA